MPDTTADRPHALVVDDEKEVADAYALRLRGLCDVETVYDGETALDVVESETIDIVLLDRHMPGMSGDQVLGELTDRDFSGRVIMVTAIDPGFDVLDMPFDDYLCKPIDREDIQAAIEQQCTILGYELLGEYFSLTAKVNLLEAELPAHERADHPAYVETQERATHLAERAHRLLEDPEAILEAFDAVAREGR